MVAGGGAIWPIRTATLHSLDRAPACAAWNLGEIEDLLPSTQPRIGAAVLVGLVPRPSGPGVLLTLRTDHLSQHAGQISFPGGRIDAGDADPVAAALRETAEEVAIPSRMLKPLGFLDPYDTVTGYRIWPVVAELSPDYHARPDPAEVVEAFEVPLEFLFEPVNCERVSVEFGGRMRHYWQFRYGHHLIWGATASMLLNLRQRLTGVAIPP
jgi:8-oxo-dGTP pyrophosphatase MutT (NUDIX family)